MTWSLPLFIGPKRRSAALFRILINFVFQINDLVSQKTEGKIQDLLLEQDVDTLTKMILINVIYFKGLFCQNFQEEMKNYRNFSQLSGRRLLTLRTVSIRSSTPPLLGKSTRPS